MISTIRLMVLRCLASGFSLGLAAVLLAPATAVLLAPATALAADGQPVALPNKEYILSYALVFFAAGIGVFAAVRPGRRADQPKVYQQSDE